MQRISLALISLAATMAAQDIDIVIPLGFGNASGPPSSSYPVARAKDQNGDGIITAEEIHAFCTTLPGDPNFGTRFMVDGRYVREGYEDVFYFCDSEVGQVIRCVDSDHSGVIEPSEATTFFMFGPSSSNGVMYSPDTLAVYHDTSVSPAETRVYVALDNWQPSSLGFARGIHRLIDLNGDGDAMDTGEQSVFVSSSMNLTVTGLSGPVPITLDRWKQVRVLPGGKVVAFASGYSIDGVLVPMSNPPVYTYTVQPEMNCWYGFTDNGTNPATAEVWFNASTLNDLPMHPDFDDPRVSSTATFPNWDIQDITATATRINYARFCDVVAGGGPNGEDVYYLASSYRSGSEGDINLNGESISGLIYRVIDTNGNQVIDPGELTLYCNMSNQTHAGIANIGYIDQNLSVVTNLAEHTWAFSTSPSGTVNFIYENGGTNDGVISMVDTNNNGYIDQGEATMPYATPQDAGGYVYPFHPSYGPYFTSLQVLGDLVMPGPFGAGIAVTGAACPSPTSGEKAVMEAWNGTPQVGNLAFEVGCIRGLAGLPAFVMGDLSLAATPLDLSALGLATGCFSYLSIPTPVGLTFGDAQGTHRLNIQIPNVPGYIGINLVFQVALLDPGSGTPVTYVVTNAMVITIQS